MTAMRLMVALLLLVALVIVDQYRFRGYDSSEVSRLATGAIRSVT
jgi:hypothetical protein